MTASNNVDYANCKMFKLWTFTHDVKDFMIYTIIWPGYII